MGLFNNHGNIFYIISKHLLCFKSKNAHCAFSQRVFTFLKPSFLRINFQKSSDILSGQISSRTVSKAFIRELSKHFFSFSLRDIIIFLFLTITAHRISILLTIFRVIWIVTQWAAPLSVFSFIPIEAQS